MKKVGIMTFHASHNYGSVLQAYALSNVIKSSGYDVSIINFRSKAQKDWYKIIKFYKGLHGVKRNVMNALYYNKFKKRYENFEHFINEVLPTTKEVDDSSISEFADSFDYYVCGSDQIWNPCCKDFSPHYYLDFVKSGKKIAYAPSMGKAEFESKDLSVIKSLIKNIDSISVREKKGKDVLSKLTEKEISVVCDPVLLAGREFWEKATENIEKRKKPYIFVYFLENNHGDRGYIDYLKKTLNIDVVTLAENPRDMFKPYKKLYDATPLEFVSLIKNASFVYTNSFHATAFSCMFNVPFCSMISKGKSVQNNNDSRKIDLLKSLSLSNRLYKSLDNVKKQELLSIDFSVANNELDKLSAFSMDYLKGAIK